MKVMTTGFFDQLNPNQLEFLQTAAKLGELHVGVGTDKNHAELKSSWPVYSQHDRAGMLVSLKCVADAIMLTGSGDADFEEALQQVRPDCYIASIHNDSSSKRELCARYNVRYQVLDLLAVRSDQVSPSNDDTERVVTDSGNLYFPYRICMTGGWLDQPWVSQVQPGGVTVLGLEPDRQFMLRGGMATSTRETAKRIWSTFPSGDPVNLAQILFGAENPPGTRYVSGSQDALGLCLPGFSLLHYEGGYWPTRIESNRDAETADWLERVVWMVPLRERADDYDPLLEQNLTQETVSCLAKSSEMAWSAVENRSTVQLGEALRLTLDSWRKMLPLTVPEEFESFFEKYDSAAGYNLSGCGGGYLIVISDHPVDGGFPIRVRR